MRSLLATVLGSALTAVGCGPSVGSSSASDGGTSATGTTGPDETTADSVSASGAADGSSTDAVDPEPKYDVGPVEPPAPPAVACGMMLPDSCGDLPWGPGEAIEFTAEASAEVLANSVRFRIVVAPPREGLEGTLEFELPCPQPAGAPKVDITRFEVPGQLEVWYPAKFEYSWVATYAVVVDAELHNACIHVQVHDIEVDPAPIEPTDGEMFAWPTLAEPGWLWITD